MRGSESELVPEMRCQRPMSSHLLGDLLRQLRCEATVNVDVGEFRELSIGLLREFSLLAKAICALRISLRTYRYVLTGRHRHGTRYQSRHAGDEDS
jgi:hypothetical protein